MSNAKSKVYEKIVIILDKFSDRLIRIAKQTRQNTDAVAELEGRHSSLNTFVGGLRDDVVELKTNTTNDLVRLKSGQDTLQQSISRVEFENNKREEAQTLRDQSNVQSFINLRDSTSKAFDRVAEDVKRLMDALQRQNERIGQIESKQNGPSPLRVDVNLLRSEVAYLKSRTAADGLPEGHEWVNKKLSGVYQVADDFEARIQKLEALVKKYETFRKAQIEFAKASGAFLVDQ